MRIEEKERKINEIRKLSILHRPSIKYLDDGEIGVRFYFIDASLTMKEGTLVIGVDNRVNWFNADTSEKAKEKIISAIHKIMTK